MTNDTIVIIITNVVENAGDGGGSFIRWIQNIWLFVKIVLWIAVSIAGLCILYRILKCLRSIWEWLKENVNPFHEARRKYNEALRHDIALSLDIGGDMAGNADLEAYVNALLPDEGKPWTPPKPPIDIWEIKYKITVKGRNDVLRTVETVRRQGEDAVGNQVERVFPWELLPVEKQQAVGKNTEQTVCYVLVRGGKAVNDDVG